MQDPKAMQSIISVLEAVIVSSLKIQGKGKMISEATSLLQNSLFQIQLEVLNQLLKMNTATS